MIHNYLLIMNQLHITWCPLSKSMYSNSKVSVNLKINRGKEVEEEKEKKIEIR